MGINSAPLFHDLFLYSYGAEFIQNLLHGKIKSLAVAFNSTFRFIDEVLTIRNAHFYSYVDLIYPSELEINKGHHKIFHMRWLYCINRYLIDHKYQQQTDNSTV